jgi:pimeloyl-ACP methyl ester carboxylesterase
LNEESIQLRIHGDRGRPTLIYLPGLHGDWTLVSSFRAAVRERVCFVEFTYPRTTTWSLQDYAHEVINALHANGIRDGWIIGESFSSQVAWQMMEMTREENAKFCPRGLILAGGFARYPILTGVKFVRLVNAAMPLWMIRIGLNLYSKYARLRHRRAPETLASIGEFIARRTEEDRQAILHRYGLILSSRAGEIACRCELPVYALTGFIDPVVPWLWTIPWLRRRCPGLREYRIILNADHNVLGTAPQRSAEQILEWIQGA